MFYQNSDVTLKCCPFCGKQHTVGFDETNYHGERYVVCNFNLGGCGARTGGADNDYTAAMKWSERHEESEIAHIKQELASSQGAIVSMEKYARGLESEVARLVRELAARDGAEPVAWKYKHGGIVCLKQYQQDPAKWTGWTETPLYAHPPKAETYMAGIETIPEYQRFHSLKPE